MKFKKDLLIIIILLLIFSLAWIGEGIYKIANNTTISEDIRQDISPIDPNIDTTTIDKLKSREQIDSTFDIDTNINPVLLASPSAAPIASEEGNILP